MGEDFMWWTKDKSLADMIGKAVGWVLGGVWSWIKSVSFPTFTILCLAGLVLSLCGWRKGKALAWGSVMAFLLIQMLSAGGV